MNTARLICVCDQIYEETKIGIKSINSYFSTLDYKIPK